MRIAVDLDRSCCVAAREADCRKGRAAIGAGEDAAAVSYVQIRIGSDRASYGVGQDSNIVTATLLAVVSAVNRAIARAWLASPSVAVLA